MSLGPYEMIAIIGLASVVVFLVTKLVEPLQVWRMIEEKKLWVYMYKRIEIAREAITQIRKNKSLWPVPEMLSMEYTSIRGLRYYPLTYGFYGLLDYIELGDPEKIMDPTMRRFVQTVIRENAQSEKGST